MDTRSVPRRVPRWPLRQPRPLRQPQQLRRYRPLLAAATLAAAVAGAALVQASPVAADTPTGPPPVTVLTQGADRDLFIGWGALPYFSEFSPSGQLEFNAEFPAGVNTYRAYRLPWFPGGRHSHRG